MIATVRKLREFYTLHPVHCCLVITQSWSHDPEKLTSLAWTCHPNGRQETTKATDVWGARFWEAKARQASQEIQRLRNGQHKPSRNYPQGAWTPRSWQDWMASPHQTRRGQFQGEAPHTDRGGAGKKTGVGWCSRQSLSLPMPALSPDLQV